MEKEKFLKEKYIPLLKKIPADKKGSWGVLSVQGMIEHMTDSIGLGWGRLKEPLQTPQNLLERARSFALSDKEFKPGTKNSLMTENAAPLRHPDIDAAIAELENEINSFIAYFQKHPNAVITNPFFGEMNYAEWLHLLHKHAVHHLKQFGVEQQ
jgi:hypothetical protein